MNYVIDDLIKNTGNRKYQVGNNKDAKKKCEYLFR